MRIPLLFSTSREKSDRKQPKFLGLYLVKCRHNLFKLLSSKNTDKSCRWRGWMVKHMKIQKNQSQNQD
ncbi:MAG: hypothetical protein ACYT04_71440, partial [Nostoc sp.]